MFSFFTRNSPPNNENKTPNNENKTTYTRNKKPVPSSQIPAPATPLPVFMDAEEVLERMKQIGETYPDLSGTFSEMQEKHIKRTKLRKDTPLALINAKINIRIIYIFIQHKHIFSYSNFWIMMRSSRNSSKWLYQYWRFFNIKRRFQHRDQ
jgi:hypothetical protein